VIPELGVVSDTHGLLRREVLPLLEGVEHIVHAGDVGGADILEQLSAIAPVTAVRGNTDGDPFGRSLPMTEVVHFHGHDIYLLHILEDLDLDPEAAGMSAVVYGHTHRPLVEDRGGVLFVNPGSCGPRRFSLPVTVARLGVTPGGLEVRLLPVTP
jgi:putative phosphoesterase